MNRFGGFASGFLKAKGVRATLSGVDASSELSKEDFKELLTKIENNLRILPATAQVARQEGEYLAQLLTEATLTGDASADAVEGKLRPFEYNHKGSLAYVGSDRAVMDIPVIGEPGPCPQRRRPPPCRPRLWQCPTCPPAPASRVRPSRRPAAAAAVASQDP